MEIDDKIYLTFIFPRVSVFNHDFFHIHWYCLHRIFKRSSWWRHKL